MLIIDFDAMNADEKFPYTADQFKEKIDSHAKEMRRILVFQWISSIADIMLKMRKYWELLVPPKQSDDTKTIQQYFDSLGSLMSLQLRGLVTKSLKHIRDYLAKYMVRYAKSHVPRKQSGNYFFFLGWE